MFAIFGLLIGLVIGLFAKVMIPAVWAPYLALLILSAIDALLAAYVARSTEGVDTARFIINFLLNTVLAMLLAALGLQINFALADIVAFVFAYRIFQNASRGVNIFYKTIRRNREQAKRAQVNRKDEENKSVGGS